VRGERNVKGDVRKGEERILGREGRKTEGKRRKGGQWSGGDGRKGFVVHGEKPPKMQV